MSRFGLTVSVAIASFILAIVMSHGPWKEYQKMRNATQKAMREANVLEKEHTELLHQDARVDSPTGMEEIAREHGYRQNNEVPIQLAP